MKGSTPPVDTEQTTPTSEEGQATAFTRAISDDVSGQHRRVMVLAMR
jgi:hypothetical protein